MTSRTGSMKSLRVGATVAVVAGVLGFLLTYTPLAGGLPDAAANGTPSGERGARQVESPSASPEPRAPAPAAGGTLAAVSSGPRYHPREPSEWQGMLVNTSAQAQCDTSARCGLAMACLRETCGPCVADSECSSGEVCVLDHCVLRERAECKSRRECPGDALCTLSGYSSDPRGNRELVAQCTPTSGQGRQPEATELIRGLPARPPEVSGMELLEQARAATGGKP
jgi:hypothetical protein